MRSGVTCLVLLALGIAGAFSACRDPVASAPEVSVSPASRIVSVHEDSTVVVPDSASVAIQGNAAESVSWVAEHGGGTWLTISTASGRGNGTVRWVRDATLMSGGTYVDTITVTAQGIGSARIIDSLVVREAPSQYIAVRRAWLPGERAAQIALVTQYRVFGAFSDLAEFIYGDSDSVTVVGLNPLYPGSRFSELQLAPAFSATWNISGLDLHQVDTSHLPLAPTDTLDWLIVFWYNPTQVTYKGMVTAFSRATTVAQTTLNTANFDANGGRAGAGGGEARTTTGEYWEANGGTMEITSGTYGAPSTIASGVWRGGTQRAGAMAGRLRNVSMPRVLPTPRTTTKWSYDFRSSAIGAAQVDCIFPSPCTGGAAQAVAALMRETRAGRVSRVLSPHAGVQRAGAAAQRRYQ